MNDFTTHLLTYANKYVASPPPPTQYNYILPMIREAKAKDEQIIVKHLRMHLMPNQRFLLVSSTAGVVYLPGNQPVGKFFNR